MATRTDNFERPNASTLGTDWTTITTTGWLIDSGAAMSNSTSTRVAQYELGPDTGSHEVTWTSGNAVGGSFVGPCAMMPTLASTLDTSGAFYAAIFSGTGMTLLGIRRHDANATGLTAPLVSGTTTALAPDSIIKLRCEPISGGVRLTAFHNGTQVCSIDETSGLVPLTNRFGGMWLSGTNATAMRIGTFAVADLAVADTTAPTTPTGLTATAASATRIDLAWTASSDAVGVSAYYVRRGGVLLSPSAASNSYSDTTVVASTTYSYTVSAVDAAGNESAQSTAASATTPAAGGANQAPTANAGPDQTVDAMTTVTLQGSGTDPDGTIASYAWTKTSGPVGPTLSSSTAQNPTVKLTTAGTYVFSLTVTDNQGLASAADAVTVVAKAGHPLATGRNGVSVLARRHVDQD